MALVSVLWGVALLSVIAVSFLSTGHTSYRLAHNALEVAQADVAAEAAINRAILMLLDPRNDQRWRLDGTARQLDFEGARITVRIQDELGRIDLNHADGSVFVNLLQSAGLDPQSASKLSDKMLDWRDTGSLKRLNGAKDPEYRGAGRTYVPRTGPFQSVDELKLVMDMTPELFDRVEPALTVYSGRQFIDPQVAPREALLALPTMDTEKVATLLAARSQTQGTGSAVSLQGRAFTIRAEIQRANGVVAREAVVRLTDHPVRPSDQTTPAYWVLSWKTR